MFVRKKRNRSGSISVVVVNKERGKFVEIKNFGTVLSEVEADSLCVQARPMGCRAGIPSLEGHTRNETDVPLHTQAHRGTRLHLLRSLQSI